MSAVDDAPLVSPGPSSRVSRAAAPAVARARFAWAPILVYTATAAWFAGILAMGLMRHAAYKTGRFDQGNMVQAIWSTAHGHFLQMTFQTGEESIRLAAHADVFLALLTPLWLVFPSPVLLIVVQTAAVALGALPVYWLARRHIVSERGAVTMVLAYLLYPWVAWHTLADFHSVTVAIGLLLFAIWALDSDRLVLFAVFAGLALTTHELVGLEIACLGLWYAGARGRWRAGAVIGAVGLAWTTTCLLFVIPRFADGENLFYGRFESLGGSPGGIARTLLTDPVAVLGAIATPNDYLYLVLLLMPLAGLWLYAPGMALVASPQLGINLLADWYASTSPVHQYTSVIIPFVFVSTLFGAARFSPGRANGAVFVAIVCGLFFLVLGPNPVTFVRDMRAAPRAALREATDLVPPLARVSATEGLGARLSERPVIYSFPLVRDADWVVIDSGDAALPDSTSAKRGWLPEEFMRDVTRFRKNASFRLVYKRDGVLVFRRRAG
jgi:uncharacterized membrane protein